jgi:hypothetical protein
VSRGVERPKPPHTALGSAELDLELFNVDAEVGQVATVLAEVLFVLPREVFRHSAIYALDLLQECLVGLQGSEVDGEFASVFRHDLKSLVFDHQDHRLHLFGNVGYAEGHTDALEQVRCTLYDLLAGRHPPEFELVFDIQADAFDLVVELFAHGVDRASLPQCACPCGCTHEDGELVCRHQSYEDDGDDQQGAEQAVQCCCAHCVIPLRFTRALTGVVGVVVMYKL